MTPLQFRRWYTFAIRMAHRGWPRLPRSSRRKVAGLVKDFFRLLTSNDDYYRRQGQPTVVERIKDWDNTDNSAMPKNYYGRTPTGPLVCDEVSEFLYNRKPAYDDHNNTWGIRVRCCIRAGLDLASAPSAGVVGFEIQDLARMYRGQKNIPEWVAVWTDSKGKKHDLRRDKPKAGVWL